MAPRRAVCGSDEGRLWLRIDWRLAPASRMNQGPNCTVSSGSGHWMVPAEGHIPGYRGRLIEAQSPEVSKFSGHMFGSDAGITLNGWI